MQSKYEPIEDGEVIRDLIKVAQSGYDKDLETWTPEAEEAKNKIVDANMRLIPFIIHKIISGRHPLFMDCVNECHFVIVKCIIGYKFDANTHFATYSQTSIRRRVWRFLREHANTVKLPSGQVSKRQKVENEIYGSKNGLDKLFKGDFEPVSHVLSLDYDYDDGSKSHSSPFKDIPCHDTASSIVLGKELKAITRHALSCLTDKEKHIIESRYLLDKKMTLEDVSLTIGTSGERVRQIEKYALKKMRRFMDIDQPIVDKPLDIPEESEDEMSTVQ
jgi:RNA polymerase sigma factor (sigma-70 family)